MEAIKLGTDFYEREDVAQLARELIGKVICTALDGHYTSGIITETEAYAGIIDKASHAYGGRRTARTKIMYAAGGVAYVYLCYGIHHLFNVVTGRSGVPHAVLLRGIEPLEGVDVMMIRRKARTIGKTFSKGPGSASQALGIQTRYTGTSLAGNRIWIEDRGIAVPDKSILVTPRIGVDYAGEDALLPYRFVVNLSLSRTLHHSSSPHHL